MERLHLKNPGVGTHDFQSREEILYEQIFPGNAAKHEGIFST